MNKATPLFLMLLTLLVVLGGSLAILNYTDQNTFIYLALLWLAACVGAAIPGHQAGEGSEAPT